MHDDAVIEALGNTVAVASALRVRRPQVVSNWKSRGIPARWRPAMLALAKARGLQLDEREFLRIPQDVAA